MSLTRIVVSALACALVACASLTKVDNPQSREWPCGPRGEVCSGSYPNAVCCWSGDVCGSGAPFSTCPAGYCCADGDELGGARGARRDYWQMPAREMPR